MMDLRYTDPQKEKNTFSANSPTQPVAVTQGSIPSVTWEHLTALRDCVPDILIIIDAAGTIVLVNAQMEAQFGYHADELIGQSLEIVLPEHLRVMHAIHRARYMQAPVQRLMGIGLGVSGRRKDGSNFPVNISLRPVLIGQALYVIGAVRDMTAQQLTEREHVNITERLHKLVSLAHDAILVRDPASHIISWNTGAAKLYGWTEQEALGHVTHVLLRTRFPISKEAVDTCLEYEGKWEGELTHICRDGRPVIVESCQVLMRDERELPTAILEINRDVTERRRLESVAQEAHAELDARLNVLRLILDQLPSGVFLVRGHEQRLLMANRAVVGLWGAEWRQNQPMEDFLRTQGVRLFTVDGRPLVIADLASAHAMASGKPVLNRQQVVCQADGTRLPVLVDAIPLDDLHFFPRLPQEMAEALVPTERAVLVVYQNVTALKEAEALKDQFISLATHELRTPVTIVSGYADLMLTRAARKKGWELNEWQCKALQEMKQAIQRLTSLTEDLLDVTRVQAGEFKLELCSTDLVALAQKVIKQLQTTTDWHHLSFQTRLQQCWIKADAFRIEQVLANLLTNAIKYSPHGGLVEVTLEANEGAQEVCFHVRDHGMGIPRAQHARIFERFVRADNAQVVGIQGTGLGLYLCRELVERHGGHIWFTSEEGVGSTFSFALPYNSA